MWILIEYNRQSDSQSNHAILHTHADLVQSVDNLLSCHAVAHAKLVMLPNEGMHPHKKIYPLVTSDTHDFYAQWMD
jgi:hypothetical protein